MRYSNDLGFRRHSRAQPADHVLREAADSVLAQTHRELELIIVATAATRDTVIAAHHIADADARCRVIELRKDSLAAARNAGIEAASGEWVAFLDDDDIWMPNKLERQLSVDADMVNCDFIERGGALDGAVRHIRPPLGLTLAEGFVLGNYGAASASGAIVRTNIIRSLGGFDEQLNGCEDWDMWRRISWQSRIVFLDEPLLIVSRHSNSMQARRPRVFHLSHTLKTMRDTPPHLRHMLRRLARRGVALFVYELLNRITFGYFSSLYRSVVEAGWAQTPQSVPTQEKSAPVVGS